MMLAGAAQALRTRPHQQAPIAIEVVRRID